MINKPKILADRNIAGLEHFRDVFEFSFCDGRAINACHVQGIDALLVRSVTQVDESLLADNEISFVGTTTIGTDHIDQAYLKGRGIAFSYAPASNANSVVDYVMSALFEIYDCDHIRHANFAIIGYGNIGSRLARCLSRFNIKFVICDPYKSNFFYKFVSFEEAIKADVISLHVPLTKGGDHPTFHLFNETLFHSLEQNKSRLIINTSRGAVVDNAATLTYLASKGKDSLKTDVLFDVWEGEPDIDLELMKLCKAGTPHIAGYSRVGKYRATAMVVSEMIKYLTLNSAQRARALESLQQLEELTLPSGRLSQYDSLEDYRDGLKDVYRLSDDAERMTTDFADSAGAEDVAFDRLRRDYPERSEIDYLL